MTTEIGFHCPDLLLRHCGICWVSKLQTAFGYFSAEFWKQAVGSYEQLRSRTISITGPSSEYLCAPQPAGLLPLHLDSVTLFDARLQRRRISSTAAPPVGFNYRWKNLSTECHHVTLNKNVVSHGLNCWGVSQPRTQIFTHSEMLPL